MYKLVVESVENDHVESSIIVGLEDAVRLEMYLNKSNKVKAVHIVPAVEEEDIDKFINELIWG